MFVRPSSRWMTACPLECKCKRNKKPHVIHDSLAPTTAESSSSSEHTQFKTTRVWRVCSVWWMLENRKPTWLMWCYTRRQQEGNLITLLPQNYLNHCLSVMQDNDFLIVCVCVCVCVCVVGWRSSDITVCLSGGYMLHVTASFGHWMEGTGQWGFISECRRPACLHVNKQIRKPVTCTHDKEMVSLILHPK